MDWLSHVTMPPTRSRAPTSEDLRNFPQKVHAGGEDNKWIDFAWPNNIFCSLVLEFLSGVEKMITPRTLHLFQGVVPGTCHRDMRCSSLLSLPRAAMRTLRYIERAYSWFKSSKFRTQWRML